MNPLEYVAGAIADWDHYLILLLVSAVLHWLLLLRTRTLGFFDPLFFILLGSVFGWAIVWFMFLRGDIALVEAWEADRWGNLTFKLSGRNFNPVMATAADITIVQSQHIVELGAIDPQNVMCPGIFVDRVIHIPYGDPPF